MKDLAAMFKALGEEPRLRILALLSQGELCVCDLMAVLALPQSTVSRHLAYLKKTGWLAGERRGAWMYYRFADNGATLHRDLRNLLLRRLAGFPEIRRDRSKLTRHLAEKTAAACK
jgi:ArsR family transcriptional regulator, arsenate/arsenite/antimonite-responsive transcriptional repressor